MVASKNKIHMHTKINNFYARKMFKTFSQRMYSTITRAIIDNEFQPAVTILFITVMFDSENW